MLIVFKKIDATHSSDEKLIKVALSYLTKNNVAVMYDYKTDTLKISEVCVDQTIKSFFDRDDIIHGSIKDYAHYTHGVYELPPASGEVLLFCQIVNVTLVENNIYHVTANIYIGNDFIGDYTKPKELWQAQNRDLKSIGNISADILITNTEDIILLKYVESCE